MFFLLSFLMFFGAAIVGLLLGMDAWYARGDVDRHLDRTEGRHWAPSGMVIVEDPHAPNSVLPPEARHRLWGLLLASFAIGCVLLVLSV
jgi:hypothetical protein